jgi:GTPase
VPEEVARHEVSAWRERLGVPVFASSAATGEGLEALRDAILEAVPAEEVEPPKGHQPATHRVYRPGEGDAYRVEKIGAGAFRVEGGRIDRLVARHDVDNDEALRYVEERLRVLGVIKALEAAGFEPGDDVEIAGIVFELDPT